MHVADVKHASSEWQSQKKMSDKEECKHFDLFSFRLFASFLRSMTVILDDGMNELENWILAMKIWFIHYFLHLYHQQKTELKMHPRIEITPRKNYQGIIMTEFIVSWLGLALTYLCFLIFIIIKASDVKHNPLNLQLTTKRKRNTLTHLFFAIHFSECKSTVPITDGYFNHLVNISDSIKKI